MSIFGKDMGGGYKDDFFPVFWVGMDSLGINKRRTHDDPVRTRWHDQENRPRRSEEVVELFME